MNQRRPRTNTSKSGKPRQGLEAKRNSEQSGNSNQNSIHALRGERPRQITKRRPREAPDHQEASKRRKKPPQKQPKSFQSLPHSTPNWFKRPLGSHVGPMLSKSWISNTRKNDQEGPREAPDRQEAPKSRPRAFQTPSKWSPRPCQIQFLSDVLPFIRSFQFRINCL